MIEVETVDTTYPSVTDGEIAVNNLESARRNAWNRFWRQPQRLEVAEYILELENFAVQFLGDLSALGRLGVLVRGLGGPQPDPAHTSLICAQVASTLHQFAEAKDYLAGCTFTGRLSLAAHRLSLSIDQACGDRLEYVLESRRQTAESSGRLEELVPLGALLADLGHFDEADDVYARALREYKDVSPFAVAWVCFQRGVLWGELCPETQPRRAEEWYRRALGYLPSYVKARVHLSEICLRTGDVWTAEALLLPVISSGDPEVNWRLADVLTASGRTAEAETQLAAARNGFEAVLAKYLLAFADHGSEFYSSGGNDPRRALELSMVNLKNRPTFRAFERAYKAAVEACEPKTATNVFIAAQKKWGGTQAFGLSRLAFVADASGSAEASHVA